MAMTDVDAAAGTAAPESHGGAGRWVALFVVLWIIAISFLAQGLGWGGVFFGISWDLQAIAFGVTLTQALLLVAPLAVLAYAWRATRYRAMFQTWLVAALVLLALSPTRW